MDSHKTEREAILAVIEPRRTTSVKQVLAKAATPSSQSKNRS